MTTAPAQPTANERKRLLTLVSRIGIEGNLLLSLFKLAAGLLGHSGAMVSDAVHSFSDVIATLVAWIGVRMSGKEADREHPYGHERFECVASILLAFILLVAGAGIVWQGLKHLFPAQGEEATAVPGLIALVAACVSILVKEAMYHYTRHCAKKLHSQAFLADARHHRSDALSSIGSLIGIAGARMNLPFMDPLASVIISVFILKVGADIFLDAISKMVDHSCPEEFEAKLRECILAEPGVIDIDILRTRTFGERIYVEAEIGLDGGMSLLNAHNIAENVHNRIEREFPDIKHIMIHENPHV